MEGNYQPKRNQFGVGQEGEENLNNNGVVHTLDMLDEILTTASHLKCRANKFCVFQDKIDRLEEKVCIYKKSFQKFFLSDNYFSRCNKCSQVGLKWLKKNSHYGKTTLKAWVENAEKELTILQNYELLLSDSGVKLVQNFTELQRKNAVVITLNIEPLEHIFDTIYDISNDHSTHLPYEDESNENDLNNDDSNDDDSNYDDSNDEESNNNEPNKDFYSEDFIMSNWHENETLKTDAIEKINQMKELAEANKTETFSFFFCVKERDVRANVSIDVWMNGSKHCTSFVPPSTVEKLGSLSTSTMLKWNKPKVGYRYVTSYLLLFKKLDFYKEADTITIEICSSLDNHHSFAPICSSLDNHHSISSSTDNVISYIVDNAYLDRSFTYKVSVICTSMQKKLMGKPEHFQIVKKLKINSINFEIYNYRHVLLSWVNQKAKNKYKFDINYKSKSEKDKWITANVDCYSSKKWFNELNYSSIYLFKILTEDLKKMEEICLYTEQMPPLKIKKAFFKDNEMIVEFCCLAKDQLNYTFAWQVDNVQYWNCHNPVNIYTKYDDSNEHRIIIEIKEAELGMYLIKAKCWKNTTVYEESEWSEIVSCSKSVVPSSDENGKYYYNIDDEINIKNLNLVFDQPLIEIFEGDSKLPALNKEIAVKKWVKSIELSNHQCLNVPITWIDNTGHHTGVYHPMDLIFYYVKNIEFSRRRKLYRKLSINNLAVPVILPLEKLCFMDMCLRSVNLLWKTSTNCFIEKNAADSELPVISMLRLGKLESISKSEVGNRLIGTKENGFFTRNSLSSNNLRNAANGLVEGLWFKNTHVTISNRDDFINSFCLLNLRGDGIDHKSASSILVSCSDVIVLFCDKEIFEDSNKWITFFIEMQKNLKKSRKTNTLIVFYTKEAEAFMSNLSSWIKKKLVISESIKFESEFSRLEKLLKSLLSNPFTPKNLTQLFEKLDKESSCINKQYLNSNFNKKLLDDLSKLSEEYTFLPFQSKVKKFSQLQRDLNRCEDLNQLKEIETKMNKIRMDKIENLRHIPQTMLDFIDNIHCSKDKTVFVYSVQDTLNDWSKENIPRVKESIADLSNTISDENSIGVLDKLKAQNPFIKKKKRVVGLEHLLREMAEIYETTQMHEEIIVNENLKNLPSMAALLLLKGFTLEILNGDGFSVNLKWIRDVLCALEDPLKKYLRIDREPRIFVLSVLGAQSSGKSTLLNTMFGLENPVSSGRTTIGSFMHLVPITIKNFNYDAFFVIDTEGLLAPEFVGIYSHDNEISTLIFGISDLTIINNRSEFVTKENFLEISACALTKIRMIDFHPCCIFVQQGCDDTAKISNSENRDIILKTLDNSIKSYAKLIGKENITRFADVVDIKDDHFFYFPHLHESSGSNSISSLYVNACSELRDYILINILAKSKSFRTMNKINDQINQVWKSVLKENFVMNFLNAAYVEARYEIDIEVCKWKSKIETHLNKLTQVLCKDVHQESLEMKEMHLIKLGGYYFKILSDELNTFIDNKKNKSAIFKEFKVMCLESMKMFYESCLKRYTLQIHRWFEHSKQKNDLKAKFNFETHKQAREVAKQYLLADNVKESEIEDEKDRIEEFNKEFDKFWNSTSKTVNEEFLKFSRNDKADFISCLQNELYQIIEKQNNKIEHSEDYFDKFGNQLQIPFKPAWIQESQHLKNFVASVEVEIKKSLDFEETDEGYEKLKIQTGIFFDCTTLVKFYLKNAEEIIDQQIATNNIKEYAEPETTFQTNGELKAFLLYHSAHIAIKPFEKAQTNFQQYLDIPNQIKNMKESVKEEFLMTLNKENLIVITAKRFAGLLQKAIIEKVLGEAFSFAEKAFLKKISLKEHLHGLILLDILHIISNKPLTTNTKSVTTLGDSDKEYLIKYFKNPFLTFEEKIYAIIDNCYLNLLDYLEVDFKTHVSNVKSIIDNLNKYDENSKADDENKGDKISLLFEDECIKKFPIDQDEMKIIVTSFLAQNNKIDDINEIFNKILSILLNAKLEVPNSFLKYKVFLAIRDKIITCTSTCPLCGAPCDCSHNIDVNHSCRCHRPEGFGGMLWNGFFFLFKNQFVTDICTDSIKCKTFFKNSDTKNKYIKYSDYKNVDDKTYSIGDKYTSWDINGDVNKEDSIFWKYITYNLISVIKEIFPDACKVNVSRWSSFSKKEAYEAVEKGFNIVSLGKLVENRYLVDICIK